MRREIKLIALYLMLSLLSGCTVSVPISRQSKTTLPPARQVYQAPDSDETRTNVETVTFYLPQKATGTLTPLSLPMALQMNRHPAEQVLLRLLAMSGTEEADALPKHENLRLQSPPELSGATATVNLDQGALALTPQERALVFRAITLTLCQWGDIRYVNILIMHKAQGQDLAATKPMGSLTVAGMETQSVYEQNKAYHTATLYYPAPLGMGILPEGKTIAVDTAGPAAMVQSLLATLSSPSNRMADAPTVPQLLPLLKAEPAFSASGVSGGQILTLQFEKAANEIFVSSGIPRSSMLAAMVLTLTTFMPELEGVRVEIGAEQIQSIRPGNLLSGDAADIQFDQGILRRQHFLPFLLTEARLFLPYKTGVKSVERLMPLGTAHNIRHIVLSLLNGPTPQETRQGFSALLPGALTESAFIGYTVENDTVLLNFSQALQQEAARLNEQEERQLVYAITNTLCTLPNIRRVRFFIGGTQPETLAGSLYLPGEFVVNTDLVIAE